MSKSSGPDPEEGAEHLADLQDGAGCAEIWARLSEYRDRDGSGDRGRDRESRE